MESVGESGAQGRDDGEGAKEKRNKLGKKGKFLAG